MAGKGKRLKQAYAAIDRNAFYGLDDAVRMIKERAVAKFDETIEIAMNLGIDPRHADQNVRGVVLLPHGTGKRLRVAVFAKGDKAKQATAGEKNCPFKSDEAAAGAWKDPNLSDAGSWGSHHGDESAWAGKWQGDWSRHGYSRR